MKYSPLILFLALCLMIHPSAASARQPGSDKLPADICSLMNYQSAPDTLAPLPLPGTETLPTTQNRWTAIGLTNLANKWVCWSPVPQQEGSTFTSIVVEEKAGELIAGSFGTQSGPIPGQKEATVALFSQIIEQELPQRMNQQEITNLKVFLSKAFEGTGNKWIPVFQGSTRFSIRQNSSGTQFSLTLYVRR